MKRNYYCGRKGKKLSHEVRWIKKTSFDSISGQWFFWKGHKENLSKSHEIRLVIMWCFLKHQGIPHRNAPPRRHLFARPRCCKRKVLKAGWTIISWDVVCLKIVAGFNFQPTHLKNITVYIHQDGRVFPQLGVNIGDIVKKTPPIGFVWRTWGEWRRDSMEVHMAHGIDGQTTVYNSEWNVYIYIYMCVCVSFFAVS